MSTLESVIWHVLGYTAIPFIVLGGIFVSTLLYLLVVKISGRSNDE
jgi:uncharacterized protein (TIGR02808 family)